MGVHTHPIFQDGGVDAAEVQVGNQVALLQIFGLGGGKLAVLPTLDVLSDDEGNARRSVVGAGTVVVDRTSRVGSTAMG